MGGRELLTTMAQDSMWETGLVLASDMEHHDLSQIDLELMITYDDDTALQLFRFLFEVFTSNAEIPYQNFSQQEKQYMVPRYFSVVLNMSPSLNSLKVLYR